MISVLDDTESLKFIMGYYHFKISDDTMKLKKLNEEMFYTYILCLILKRNTLFTE